MVRMMAGVVILAGSLCAGCGKKTAKVEGDAEAVAPISKALDGKTFAESTMVVALGITMTGEKRFLGFVETDTENEKVVTPFLRSLVERGLDVSQGLLENLRIRWGD